MAASMSCSALKASAPWICARRRREPLAETLAPVGPQAPPAPSARCALDSASERRGALLWTTGTSCVRVNLSTMSPNTCPPCLRPLYRLPVIPRCSRVIRQAYHVWGIDNAGILFSQRTGGGGAAALGTTGKRACVPAGSDDREHARGDGARGSGAAGWVEPVGGLRVA